MKTIGLLALLLGAPSLAAPEPKTIAAAEPQAVATAQPKRPAAAEPLPRHPRPQSPVFLV